MANLSSTNIQGNITATRGIDAKGGVYIDAVYENGWGDHSTTYASAGYVKVAGVVFLKGLVAGGSSNSTIFTLPSGYRPENTRLFVTITSSNALGRVDVFSDGRVRSHSMNSSSWVSLEGLCFVVQQ